MRKQAMPNNYSTDSKGIKRRAELLRAKRRAEGLKTREVWAKDDEISRLKAILAVWRGEEDDPERKGRRKEMDVLNEDEKKAAEFLKPKANP